MKMCISGAQNGSVKANKILKSNLYLKKVASDILVNSSSEKDILEAVKDLPKRNWPIVAKKSLSPKPKDDTKIVRRPGTSAFIKIMSHARNCNSCENLKCKKMKLVYQHFIQCPKNGQNCPLCRQLIGLMSSAFTN